MSNLIRYEVGDGIIELPSDIPEDELGDILSSFDTQQTPSTQPEETPSTREYQPRDGKVHPRTLKDDEDWLFASRVMYQRNHNKDFEGSNEDLAEYGLEFMGWFNYNLPAMAVQTGRLQHSDDETREAMLHLMESYDNLNITWGGAGRFFRGVLTDPTTYVGLGTLGFGLAGREAGRQVTRQGIRELLKQGAARTGSLAAVEGAGYSVLDNRMRQEVRIQAGVQDEVNRGEQALSGVIGAAAGLGGGTLLDAGVSGIAQRNLPTQRTSSDTPELPSPSNTQTPETPQGLPNGETGNPSVISRTFQDATQDGYVPALRDEYANLTGEFFEFTRVSDLNVRSIDTTIPYERQNMEENIGKSLGLAEELKGLHHTQVEDVISDLRTTKMTVSEFESFALSTKLARDMAAIEYAGVVRNLKSAKGAERIERLQTKKNEVEALYSKLTSMDEALASHAGYSLRQRQEGLQGLKGKNPEEMGDEEFAQEVFRAMDSYKMKRHRQKFDEDIEAAAARGDMGRVMELQVQKELETDLLLRNTIGKKATFTEKLVEAAISNVFSPTTLMINLFPSAIKAISRPALNAVVNSPTSKATRITTSATYGAMSSATKGAFRSAVAAFKYEQAILTRGDMRFFENSGLALEGKFGAVVRTIPRVMNATDEFLSRLTYNGFIAGRAAGEALEEGKSRGLTGNALDDFVKTRTRTAVEKSYSNLNAKSNIDVVAAKGLNRGYSGDQLVQYVKTELQRSGGDLSRGTDKDGIRYVEDVLYKRRFSGKGTSSSLAKHYEEATNAHPILKLMGQLFFRTPVRVIEEGIRLTPALQLVAPNFIKDLTGRNGSVAQVRARGEALASMAMTGTFMNLYAQGRITGDGDYDHWRQQRGRSDGDRPPPYSIVLSDGSTWSYRNFDPIATPLKIMANAMDRYGKYQMLKEQGELDVMPIEKQMFQAQAIVTTAILASIRDANLFGGIDGVISMFESIDQEDEASIVRFVGEKLRMALPNTLHKATRTLNPEMTEPVSLEQVLNAQVLQALSLGQYDGVIPQSYDVLGNVRQLKDYQPLWNIFATTSEEARGEGKSEEHLKILNALDDISRQTGARFSIPVRHSAYGNQDLRLVQTKDGKETLYDRWNRYTAEFDPAKALLPIIESGLPRGTYSHQGAMVTQIQSILNEYREAAFHRLMSEEAGVTEEVIKTQTRKAEIESGRWDSFR